MKKGNDFKHFSRNSYYDFINQYVTVEEEDVDDAARSGRVGEVQYHYDTRALKTVMSKSYWKPQKNK